MTKILIAEDEPDIRDLIAFTLRFRRLRSGDLYRMVKKPSKLAKKEYARHDLVGCAHAAHDRL
jgi:CheY-like chemotaxis protein